MHAHVSIESQDCDGRYSRSYILAPNPDQDEWGYRAEMIGNALAYADSGTTVQFTEWGFTVNAATDEGYAHTEVTWCTDADTDQRGTFRDHTAESMGY